MPWLSLIFLNAYSAARTTFISESLRAEEIKAEVPWLSPICPNAYAADHLTIFLESLRAQIKA